MGSWSWCRGKRKKESGAAPEKERPKLQPLTPKYDEDKHGHYVELLNEAVAAPGNLNIALTGDYGVGKSSILQGFLREKKRRDRAVEISLSTLMAEGSHPASRRKQDASGKGGSAAGEHTEEDGVSGERNREGGVNDERSQERLIQREIVKQLLYSRKPSKLPASRFRRIRHVGWSTWAPWKLAFIVFLLVLVIGQLFGVGVPQPIQTMTGLREPFFWQMALSFSGACFAAIGYSSLANRFSLRQLGAGPAMITLGENDTASYFDRYLDEIVYFFEQTRCEYVVFEDIDRFGDIGIFESLRALNQLLNTAVGARRTVRFIYAVRSSVFDVVGINSIKEVTKPSDEDLSHRHFDGACERTKFFDVIIPVVSFVSHNTAKDVLWNLVKQLKPPIDESQEPRLGELIDLAGRYVYDMRLLKNVRNEFLVYRHELKKSGGDEGPTLQLDDVKILAMILYKNVYLYDFEKIRRRRSRLDVLYQCYRKVLGEEIDRLDAELVSARAALNHADGFEERSKLLGERMRSVVDECISAMSVDGSYRLRWLKLNGKNVSLDALSSPSTWRDFLAGEAVAQILGTSSSGAAHLKTTLFLRRDLLATLLEDDLDTDTWHHDAVRVRERAVAKVVSTLGSLQRADFALLLEHEADSGASRAFTNTVKTSLDGGLSNALVEKGFIDQNFALYASHFHEGRSTANASNFRHHHIETGTAAPRFRLSDEDVHSLLRELKESDFAKPGAKNFDLLGRLLLPANDATVDKRRSRALDAMLNGIASSVGSGRGFLLQYLLGLKADNSPERDASIAKQGAVLIKKLSPLVPYIFELIAEAFADERQRSDERSPGGELLDVALRHFSENVEYTFIGDTREFLRKHYPALGVLTDDSDAATQKQDALRIARLFERASVRVNDLSLLAPDVRRAFVDHDRYQLSIENLKCAVDGGSVALDGLKGEHEEVFERVKGEFGAYLSQLPGSGESSVEASEKFAEVLQWVNADFSNHLDAVVKQAAEGCEIESLGTVDEAVWPALARNGRFKLCAENVLVYVKKRGGIDDELRTFLREAEHLDDLRDGDEKQRAEVAYAILDAGGAPPAENHPPLGVGRIVEIVQALGLEQPLDVKRISAPSGELWAELVANHEVPDSVDTLAHIMSVVSSARDRALSTLKLPDDKSLNGCLNLEQALDLLTSQGLKNPRLKMLVIDDCPSYLTESNTDAVNSIAAASKMLGHSPLIGVVTTLAKYGASSDDVLSMIPRLRDEKVSEEQIRELLANLKEPYSALLGLEKSSPVELPRDAAHNALLNRMKEAGFHFEKTEKGGNIIVSKASE